MDLEESSLREVISIISEICSILSFLLSSFIASKLIRNSKSNNDNKGEIIQGDGDPTIAKDHSAISNSSVVHNEYKDSVIYTDLDFKPVLKEKKYPIMTSSVIKYRENIPDITSEIVSRNHNNIILSANFLGCELSVEKEHYIGYCIKTLPLRDWRSFIDNNFSLSFDCERTGTIHEFYIEFKNCIANKKIWEFKVSLTHEKQTLTYSLKDFKNVSEDWKSVDEMCVVFFPDESDRVYRTIALSNLIISAEE